MVHLLRKPQLGYHSFERLFEHIRAALPSDIEVRVVHSWFHSHGIFPRLLNCLQAFFLRADVVHITGDIHYLTPAIAGRRTVLTIHDLAPLRPKSGVARRVFSYFWYTLPMRYASVTTTISHAVRRELEQTFGARSEKVRVIPNCISPEFIPVHKDWPETPVVLMVGTRPQKNIERMFQALTGLNARVHVVGKLTEAQRVALEKTQVLFTELGRLSDADLLRAYRDCDLLAFASTYEGFGLPVLEAQATGRPVLTSEMESLMEVAGESALLVDPESLESIRQGFERLLGDQSLRAALVEKGLANVQRFQCREIAEKYVAVYTRS